MRRTWPVRRVAAGLLVSALTGIAALVAGAQASVAPSTVSTFVLQRTTTGPARLAVSIQVYDAAEPAVIAAFLGRVEAGRGLTGIHDAFVAGFDGGPSAPQVYAAGATYGCNRLPVQPAPLCLAYDGTAAGATMNYSDAGAPGAPNLAVLAIRGQLTAVTLAAASHGWALRKARVPVALVDGAHGGSTGARASGVGAEVFTAANQPGPRGGSVAIAALPCASPVTGAATLGVGFAQLHGGQASPSLSCLTGAAEAADFATRATAWSLTGTVVGVDGNVGAYLAAPAGVRLAVLGLPAAVTAPRPSR